MTRFRLFAIGAAAAVVLAACSSSPVAPPVGVGTEVCTDGFCVTIPDGWDAEVGDTYIAANHQRDPSNTFLTVGRVNQQAIVEQAGGQWPVPTSEVARAFWTLLENADVGEYERSERMIGGAVRTWGEHDDGDMWHLLSPSGGFDAIGIEIRAPNASWEPHADFVFESLEADN